MAKAKRTTFALKLEAISKLDGIKAANKQIRDLQAQVRKLQPLLNMTKKAMLGLAGTAYAFHGLAKSAQQFGAEVLKTAEAVGTGTTQLQVLGRIAAQNGAKMEDMDKALLKLTKSTQDAAGGNKQLAERFVRLGIDLQTFKTLAPERQMERLAGAVATASNRQETLAELMGLIGQDAAPKLMQALDQLGTQGYDALRQKAEAAGQIMSEASILALERAVLTDFGHKIKIWTASLVSAASEVKQVWGRIGEDTLTAQKAIERYGATHKKTFAALLREGADQLATGNLEAAASTLKLAENAASATHEVKSLWARISSTLGQSLILPIRPVLSVKGGPFGKDIREQLSQELEHQQTLLAQATHRQNALSAEAARVTAKQALDDAAATAKAEQTLKLQKAKQTYAQLAKEAAAFAKIRDSIHAQIQRDEEATWTAQLKAAEALRDTLAQADFDRLAPSEQLRAQTAQFHAQVAALAEHSLLTTEELSRAQALYNEKLREADTLLKDEDKAATFAALSERIKGLIDDFAALDAKIESELSDTLTEFVTTGQADMKKLGKSILNDVIKAMMKALILKPLLTGLGGLFGGAGGGLFSAIGGAFGGGAGGAIPGRAKGGAVAKAKPYLVGERGPELFLPPHSGTIIDANKTAAALAGDTTTGGERTPQNIYHVDARGADAGAVVRLEAALMRLAGPGVVERRAHAAQADHTRRG